MRASPVRIAHGIGARPRWRGSKVGCMPKTPSRAIAMNGSWTSCDQPTTKTSSGSSFRTAFSVSSALTSFVSINAASKRAATSSKAHWPERFGSIGPGSVTTPTISAPAFAAASRQSRPIVSKLTQTVRIAARCYRATRRRTQPPRGRGRSGSSCAARAGREARRRRPKVRRPRSSLLRGRSAA